MLDSLNRFKKAKTIRELITIMTWKDLDMLAAFPLMLFMISPAVFFWQITFIKEWAYEMTTNSILTVTAIFSIIVMTCDLSKQFLSGSRLKKTLSDYLPQILFLIMAVLILISTFINGFTEYALIGHIYRSESVFNFLSYVLCFYSCASVIRYARTKKFLLNSFIAASSFISIVSLLDYFGIIPVWHFHLYQENALTAVFYNSNHFGYYLAIAVTVSFAMCLFEEAKIPWYLYLVSLVLHTITLVINRTRGCYLACLGAVIVTCLVYVKSGRCRLSRLIPSLSVLIASAVTGFVVFPQGLVKFMRLFRDVSDVTESVVSSDTAKNADHAGSGRWLLWKLTFGAILQKPLFGWGTEGIADILSSSAIHNMRTHNEYLQYAAFYGIPACLSYLSSVAVIYYRACRRLKSLSGYMAVALMGGLAYLISACFGNTMFYTTPFLFILLGLGFRTEKEDQ